MDHCLWTFDRDGFWATACGEAFVLTDENTPSKHGMRFCPFCGRPLVESAEETEADRHERR
jgi:hypothetical protein